MIFVTSLDVPKRHVRNYMGTNKLKKESSFFKMKQSWIVSYCRKPAKSKCFFTRSTTIDHCTIDHMTSLHILIIFITKKKRKSITDPLRFAFVNGIKLSQISNTLALSQIRLFVAYM